MLYLRLVFNCLTQKSTLKIMLDSLPALKGGLSLMTWLMCQCRSHIIESVSSFWFAFNRESVPTFSQFRWSSRREDIELSIRLKSSENRASTSLSLSLSLSDLIWEARYSLTRIKTTSPLRHLSSWTNLRNIPCRSSGVLIFINSFLRCIIPFQSDSNQVVYLSS
jgi:hypothetical protein